MIYIDVSGADNWLELSFAESRIRELRAVVGLVFRLDHAGSNCLEAPLQHTPPQSLMELRSSRTERVRLGKLRHLARRAEIQISRHPVTSLIRGAQQDF